MYITEHPGCTQDEVTAWMIAFDGLSDNRVGNYLAELVKYQFVHVETVKLAEGGMVGYGYYVNERAKWFLEKR